MARVGFPLSAVTRIVLASRSPARLATLRAAGVEPEVIISNVDEDAIGSALPDASPAQLAQVLATAKADAVAAQVEGSALVLGCDSVFELDGRPYGKPLDENTARARWAAMFGRTGTLHTGHCVIDTATGARVERTASTDVTMGALTSEEIEDYLASGEPLEVAGGFTLDGLGGAFVESIHGDPSTVIGVSLPTLRAMLADIGVRWTALWNGPTATDAQSR